ncbi:unnamed protein product, partial [marine sediment metagenome]
VFLQLTQACFAHAWAAGFENMFIAVSPGHASFFHDFLQFERGARRDYSDEVEDIVEGMTLSVANSENLARGFDELIGPQDAFLYDFFFTKNHHHRHIHAWTHMANRIFTDPLKLRELFISSSNLLLNCSANELDAIQRRWGDDVFWNVWGEQSPLAGSQTLCPVAQTSAA